MSDLFTELFHEIKRRPDAQAFDDADLLRWITKVKKDCARLGPKANDPAELRRLSKALSTPTRRDPGQRMTVTRAMRSRILEVLADLLDSNGDALRVFEVSVEVKDEYYRDKCLAPKFSDKTEVQ